MHRLPELALTEAVVLFAHRAQDADPSFVLGDATAPIGAAICFRLWR